MKTLKSTTKQAQRFIDAYNRSNESSLYQCYCRPSQNKLIAETQCRAKMLDTCGHDFRIMSHSHFYFTCGWQTVTGNLAVETPSESYIIIRESL